MSNEKKENYFQNYTLKRLYYSYIYGRIETKEIFFIEVTNERIFVYTDFDRA